MEHLSYFCKILLSAMNNKQAPEAAAPPLALSQRQGPPPLRGPALPPAHGRRPFSTCPRSPRTPPDPLPHTLQAPFCTSNQQPALFLELDPGIQTNGQTHSARGEMGPRDSGNKTDPRVGKSAIPHSGDADGDARRSGTAPAPPATPAARGPG